MNSPDGIALPENALLLHIGPHKTGTSAIQGALAAAREQLPSHGVVYPGRKYSHNQESQAALGRTPGNGRAKVGPEDWQGLLDAAHSAADKRVAISSEVFDFATQEQAEGIITDLGDDRVHVVVTLRPLASMLPSIWQQRIKARGSIPYEKWLRRTFSDKARDSSSDVFWHQHRHDALVERWMKVVGRDNITVVVVDSAQPNLLFRSFEQLLSLPEGVLEAQPDKANRSLTAGEVETLRRLNIELDRRDISASTFGRMVRLGTINWLKNDRTPGDDEPRIGTPQWALDDAVAVQHDIVAGIESLGVRVMGDLATLAVPRTASPTGVLPEKLTDIPVDIAVQTTLGAVLAGDRVLAADKRRKRRAAAARSRRSKGAAS